MDFLTPLAIIHPFSAISAFFYTFRLFRLFSPDRISILYGQDRDFIPKKCKAHDTFEGFAPCSAIFTLCQLRL
jgi:hypothetical protein